MSTQAVAQFLELVVKDQDLQAQLNVKGKTREERIGVAVDLGAKKGVDFTGEECAAVIDAVRKVRDGELDDSRLEAVAGGGVVSALAECIEDEENSLFSNDVQEEEGFEDAGSGVVGVRG